MDVSVIEKLGLPIALVIAMFGALAYMVKTILPHFIRQIEQTNASFLAALNGVKEAIHESAVAIKGVETKVEDLSERVYRLTGHGR